MKLLASGEFVVNDLHDTAPVRVRADCPVDAIGRSGLEHRQAVGKPRSDDVVEELCPLDAGIVPAAPCRPKNKRTCTCPSRGPPANGERLEMAPVVVPMAENNRSRARREAAVWVLIGGVSGAW